MLHLTLASSFLSYTGHITKDGTSSVTSASSFITFLNQSGRKLHPVKGDGNCMFRCFSHHLLGNEEEHDAVRTLIIRFENFNRQYFEPLLMNNNEPTLKGHVSKMCRPFTWGTQIEIEAVACLFQVPVYECVQSQDGKTYHWEVHHPRAQADQFRLPPIVEDDPLWACLHEKLSLWLHSWQEIWRTLYYIPWDSSTLHKFNLELHVNRTVTQCLTFLLLYFVCCVLICTLHHQLVIFTW